MLALFEYFWPPDWPLPATTGPFDVLIQEGFDVNSATVNSGDE